MKAFVLFWPVADPTALVHFLLTQLLPDLVRGGKMPNSVLIFSAPFAAWDGHAVCCSSGWWAMSRYPLGKFWDRCQWPGPSSFFLPWKWSRRLGGQLFRRRFSQKPEPQPVVPRPIPPVCTFQALLSSGKIFEISHPWWLPVFCLWVSIYPPPFGLI